MTPRAPLPSVTPRGGLEIDLAPDVARDDKFAVIIHKEDGRHIRYWMAPGMDHRDLLEEGDRLIDLIPPASLMGAKPPTVTPAPTKKE